MNTTTQIQLTQRNNDDVVINRRHAFVTVYANSDGSFRLTSFDDSAIATLNPGLSSFPWLSKIASAYTKYVIQNFQLEYVPLTGLTNSGQVSYYIDYEGRDPRPMHVSDFYDQKDTTTTAIFRKASRNYQQQDLMSSVKEKIIKSEGLFNILEDFGVLYVATEGMVTPGVDGTVVVGVIYAQYKLILRIPQVNVNLGVGQMCTTSMQYIAGDDVFDTSRFGTLAVIHGSGINTAPNYRIVNHGIYQVIFMMNYTTVAVNETPSILVNNDIKLATYEVHRRPGAQAANHGYLAVFYLQLDIDDLVRFTLGTCIPIELENHFFNIAQSWYPLEQIQIRQSKRNQPKLQRVNAHIAKNQQQMLEQDSDISTDLNRQIDKVMNKRNCSK